MGTELLNKQITYITIFKYAEEIKKIERDKPDSYIQEVIKLLLSFIKSDDFTPFFLVNKENFFFNFFIMCELGKEKDKYLFIKILFPLLEELKKSQFEHKLWEINHIKKDEQKKLLISYYNKNNKIINEKINNYRNNSKKPFDVLANLIKNKSETFGSYLSTMTNVLFANEEIVKKMSKSQNIIDEALNFFNPYFYYLKNSKDYDTSKLVEYLMELYPSLENIKVIYNITMFAILKALNEKEMKLYFGNNEKQIDFLKNIVELKDNFTLFYQRVIKKI